jgi:flagella basal body P-ring formation protein FlgA
MGFRRFPNAPAVLLLLLLLFVPLAPASGVSVYLQRTVRAGGEVLLLGDLAAVTAVEPREAERLRLLPLWRPSGNPELVSAALIKERLAGVAEGPVAVVGSHAAILPATVTASAEVQLYTALLARVASLRGADAGRLEVETLSPVKLTAGAEAASEKNPSELTVEVSLSGPLSARGGSGAYAGGLYQVSCALSFPDNTGGGRGSKSVSFGIRVRQYLPVLFAVRDLAAGTVLNRELVELRDEEVGDISGQLLGPGDRPEAYRTIAPIPRGQRIDPSRLQRNYLVRAGDPVALVFVRPGLQVSVPGRAFASGAAGDRIEVMPRGGSRRFLGTVVPTGEVIVEELM